MYIRLLDDDPAMVARCNDFLRQFHQVRAAVPTADIQRQIRQHVPFLPAPITAVAVDGKTIIGAATAWAPVQLAVTVARSHGAARAERIAKGWNVLTFMAVTPRKRGRGIGRQLVDALEQGCRQAGVHTLYGFAEDLPDPSWPFYEKAGYTIAPEGHLLDVDGITVGQEPGRSGRHFHKTLTGTEDNT